MVTARSCALLSLTLLEASAGSLKAVILEVMLRSSAPVMVVSGMGRIPVIACGSVTLIPIIKDLK